MPGVIRRVGRAVEGTGLENRRAQAPWVRIPHSPPDKKRGPKGPFLRRFSRNAGQCRRHAAGSRCVRRPRRSNQSGPTQKRSFCGEPNRRAQAPWVRIPHSPPDRKRGPKGPFFCAGFQETPASAGVMPQGAAVCGDRGGQINRGPRKSAAFVGSQTGVRKHRGFESHTLRQIEKEGRKALFYVLQRKVPRLRARRTASTFHRRKVDRKAAGGPFYPRRRVPASDFRQFICRKSMKFPGDPAKPVLRGNRNAPRNPLLIAGVSAETPLRHRSAGRARSDGRNHVPPVNPLLFGRRSVAERRKSRCRWAFSFSSGRFLTDLCQETVFIFPGRRASLY